jgi:hypothetical protein
LIATCNIPPIKNPLIYRCTPTIPRPVLPTAGSNVPAVIFLISYPSAIHGGIVYERFRRQDADMTPTK